MGRTLGELQAQLLRLPHGAGTHPDTLEDLVNDACEQILGAYPWTRLRIDASLTVPAAYQAGTISVVQGAVAFTGSGTVWTAAMQGRMIRVNGREEYYGFGFGSATAGTFNSPYEGDTAAAATYEILQRVYPLPDQMSEIEAIALPGSDLSLERWSARRLDDADPARLVKGVPAVYVPVGDGADSISQVELWPVPNVQTSLRVRGKRQISRLAGPKETFPSWLSIPALVALCEAKLYGLQKDAAGKQMAMLDYKAALADMINEDNRRRPGDRLATDARFAQHRVERLARGRRIRNWDEA